MSKKKKKSNIKSNKQKKKQQPQKKALKLPPYLIALIITCAVMLIAVIAVSIVVANRPPKIEFIAPDFETNAIEGSPDVPEKYAYKELYQEGMPFKSSICGNIFTENNEAVLYFTNPESNDAWLKVRITDEQGNILGESGIIKPGEYVRSVKLNKELSESVPVKIKLMGYEAETYNSLGSVTVKSNINVK